MVWNAQLTQSHGVVERGFELKVEGRSVPGVYWCPEESSNRIVLLGHGGSSHKKIDYIVNVAQMLCAKGIAALAIDAPGHGERRDDSHSRDPSAFAQIWHANGGTNTILLEWRAALDFIEAEEGARPTGWWGLSMGTMMGLPVTASDDRIKVAVLGLMGNWGPNGEDLCHYAPKVNCPVRFLVQWDDEVVPRDTAIELYTLLGTKKKTLHANPGVHQAVPKFELSGSVGYLDQYL